jgi:2'-hydroxyisoflavone reductase
MRILVLGGTLFLGRHVAEEAVARGHEVTLFNRGQTRPELFPELERLHGDRDGDLGALSGRSFDAVVDTSGRVPRLVRDTIDALGEVGHYTFVSSISVYADLSEPPTSSTELKELEEPSEDAQEHYGELKVDCEEVVRDRFPGAFIPRPGLIVGPWDPTNRFTYWPERIAAGGRVLAPAPPEADFQVIDARDLAAWFLDAAESALGGTYDAVGPLMERGAALETIRRAVESDAEFVWVETDFLIENGVGEWMELPLWLYSTEYASMLSVDPTAAFDAGLRARPLEETSRDTLAWVRTGDTPEDPPAGFDRAKERRVLDNWLSKD